MNYASLISVQRLSSLDNVKRESSPVQSQFKQVRGWRAHFSVTDWNSNWFYPECEYFSGRVVEVSSDHGHIIHISLINGSYLQLSELSFKLILSGITNSKQNPDCDVLETETRGGERSVSSLHLGHGPVTYYGILNTELRQETIARSYDQLAARPGDETSRSEVEEMSDTDNTGNNT